MNNSNSEKYAKMVRPTELINYSNYTRPLRDHYHQQRYKNE